MHVEVVHPAGRDQVAEPLQARADEGGFAVPLVEELPLGGTATPAPARCARSAAT